MDKWFDQPWVLKGVSLFIAILLFLLVSAENNSGTTGGIPGITAGTRVLDDVPLTVYYDEESQVVTDAPESVQVTLTGPQNLITILLLERTEYELYIDMRGKEAGTHYEQVRARGFPSDLSVSILPNTVQVTVEERETVSLPIELILLNEGDLQEGYSVGTPTMNPSSVNITAASSVIEAIEDARAYVDVSGLNETYNDFVDVSIYDVNGEVIELDSNPSSIEVNVPVASPNKEVTLNIDRSGDLPSGIGIESITIEPAAVSIYGPLDVINNIDEVDLPPLDLSTITESVELEVPVPTPSGVERIAPEKVTVEVEVILEETEEMEDVAIEITGLDEGFDYEFIEPENGLTDFEIVGISSVLQRVDENDFELYVDLEGLSEGEHDLPIRVNGPQNVRVRNTDFTVTLRIIRLDSDESAEESEQGGETEEVESQDEENGESE